MRTMVGVLYFVTAVSYVCKMFMKLTSRLPPLLFLSPCICLVWEAKHMYHKQYNYQFSIKLFSRDLFKFSQNFVR
jgi:hypothetical protein